MKKILLSTMVLVLMASSLLAREVYESNALGQDLAPKPSLSGQGWELSIDGDLSVLYQDGAVYYRRFEKADGYLIEYTDHELRVFSDEEGKTIRRIEGDEEINYFYEGRLLSAVNYSVGGEVTRRVEYLRTSDGRLLGYRDGSVASYVSGSILVHSSEEGIVIYGEEYSQEKTIQETEDGGYTEDDGVVRRTYSGEGRLLKEEHPDYSVVYSYSPEGALLESRREGEDEILSTLYADGKALKTILYGEDGIIRTESVALDDGTIEETRYIDGVPRYRFHFDRDGKRVLEATAL